MDSGSVVVVDVVVVVVTVAIEVDGCFIRETQITVRSYDDQKQTSDHLRTVLNKFSHFSRGFVLFLPNQRLKLQFQFLPTLIQFCL